MTFKSEVLAIKDEIVSTTRTLIKYNTVETQPLPNEPFGKGNREALDYLLAIGKQWGFTTKDLDGFARYIEFGEGEEVVVTRNCVHIA